MEWAEKQDRQIDEALDATEAAFNASSPLRRMGAHSSRFIAERHLLNVLSCRAPNERFSLIDVGCGAGDLLALIAQRFPNAELAGLDPNEKSLARAQIVVPRARLSRGDFAQATGTYDVVLCCEVFEHVEDYQSLLDKLYELTAPGGVLSISTPSGWLYRIPRRFTVETAIRKWSWYRRNCLEPEKNWAEALAVHPGIFPSKLVKLCERRGFTLVSRQSALWLLIEGGVVDRYYQRRARSKPEKAAIDYFNLLLALDGLMNWLPLFRFRESRFILALKKPV